MYFTNIVMGVCCHTGINAAHYRTEGSTYWAILFNNRTSGLVGNLINPPGHYEYQS